MFRPESPRAQAVGLGELAQGAPELAGLAVLDASGPCPAARGRLGRAGGGTAVQHRHRTGTATSGLPGAEFVFRDAKQHLGLHDCQARAQAKLHFHFNLVFSACFWMRLQARAARDDPRDRFSLYQVKCHNHEWEMYQRFEAWSAAGRNGTQSQAVDHGIPADHPWHWASPLATGLSGS